MPTSVIGALAPVVASGVSQIFAHKSQTAAAKQQQQYEAQQAAAQEAARKAEFEAQQNSPSALASRQKFTVQLGKLLGAAGGKDKIPPSIYNYLQGQRQAAAYVPGAAPIPKPITGGSIWDVLGGAGQALSYLDTSKLKGKPTPPIAQPSGLEGAMPAYQTGQVQQLQAQNPAEISLLNVPLKRGNFPTPTPNPFQPPPIDTGIFGRRG